jgi:hypothetical protein
MDTAGSV